MPAEITVSLDEIVTYARELMAMRREELTREARFQNPRAAMKVPEVILYCLEKKFNGKLKDPTAGVPPNPRNIFMPKFGQPLPKKR